MLVLEYEQRPPKISAIQWGKDKEKEIIQEIRYTFISIKEIQVITSYPNPENLVTIKIKTNDSIQTLTFGENDYICSPENKRGEEFFVLSPEELQSKYLEV